MLVASWNDANGGGITTQGETLGELEKAFAEAVRCHFDKAALPGEVRLHFANDPIVQFA